MIFSEIRFPTFPDHALANPSPVDRQSGISSNNCEMAVDELLQHFVNMLVLGGTYALLGIGLTLMLTLRDPLRDTLAFSSFAQGVAAGCLIFAVAASLDYRRISGKLSYVFLIAAFLLSAALILFGSGPTGSDAKVNLLGFQPAEMIRVLIVFFLAGYFAERWEFLRTLRDQRKSLKSLSRWVEVPRLEYLLPVLGGIVVSLAFFFLQKDLGPALLIA